MKKIITAMLFLSIVMPGISHAQSFSPEQLSVIENLKQQIIQLLIQEIAILQEQLNIMLAQENQTVAPQSPVTNTESTGSATQVPVLLPTLKIERSRTADGVYAQGQTVSFLPLIKEAGELVQMQVTTDYPNGFNRFHGLPLGSSATTSDQSFTIRTGGNGGSIDSELNVPGTYQFTFLLPEYGVRDVETITVQ